MHADTPLMPDSHLPFPASDAPFWSAYMADRASMRVSMAIPGHKMRTDLTGDCTYGDRPVLLNRDPNGPSLATLEAAERKAAELWGADVARFSVNGSTAANQAALTALVGPGDEVVMSRTLHKSLLFGLVQSGAHPVWVTPEVDHETGLPLGVAPEAVRRALASHPNAKAVFLGEPSYVGTFGDIAGQAAICHEFGVPLVIDAAWAAHFGFHPLLPGHALSLGADIMVTSAHKTLPAHTQAAILFARSERVDIDRLNHVFDGTQTTSQAASILASIDASRALLEHSGERYLGQALAAVASAKRRLRTVPGLVVLDGDGVDPMKLVIMLAKTGVDGRDLARDLRGCGIDVEAADRDMIIPLPTLSDRPGDISLLSDLIVTFVNRRAERPRPQQPVGTWMVDPEMVMAPREAFYRKTAAVSWDDAVGKVAGELIAPYPPGIPVITPGERITSTVRSILESARDAGITLAYAADPTVQTVRVIVD